MGEAVVERVVGGQRNSQPVQFMLSNADKGRRGNWQTPQGETPSSIVISWSNAANPPPEVTRGTCKFKIVGYYDYPEGPRPRHPPTAVASAP